MAFLLALVSFLAYLIHIGIFIALHFLPTGYHPICHAVSDYAVGKYHDLFKVYLWCSALGPLALAAGLAVGLGSPPVPAWILVLLALLAVVRFAMSLFPTDIEGQPLTRTGIVHYVFAILAFAFAYTVVVYLTPTLRTIIPWQALEGPLGLLSTLTLPALIGVIVTLLRPLRRVFGLFERIFLITTNLWFILVGAWLLTKTI